MHTWVQRDGRRLYCYQSGSGTPIILLHATLVTGRFWASQMEPLLSAGFQVIVPDLAGHGASDPPPNGCGLNDLVEDVWAVQDALGIKASAIAGVSLGALIGLAAAASNPKRVKQLVVASTGLSTSNPMFQTFAKQWASQLRQTDGPLESFDFLWKSNLSEEFRDTAEGHRIHQEWHADAAMGKGDGIATVLEGTCGFDVSNPGQMSVETLVIVAGKDAMAPLARHLACTLPQAQIVELSEAHHFPNVDSAKEFNKAMIAFVRSHSS